jgi:hypothetical protein
VADVARGPFPTTTLKVLALATLLGGFGVYDLFSGLRGRDEMQELDVASLEDGQAPPSKFVRLHGELLQEQAVSIVYGRRMRSVYHYVPIVSSRWRPEEPARAYLDVSTSGYGRAVGTNVFTGRLLAGPLPYEAAVRFSLAGHPPADHIWLLRAGDTPAMRLGRGRALIGVATAIAVLAGLALWFGTPSTRRR